MRASVIILSHRPGSWLEPCVQSVVDQADEVVLVDNGSDHEAASAIGREHGARVVRSETNLGYAAGVNLAVRHASGDLIALLNDDAVASPHWLAAAGAVLTNDEVAAVVPKVVRSGWYREVVLHDVPCNAPGDHRVLGRMIRSITSDGEDVLELVLGSGIHQIERSSDGAEGLWRWTRPGAPFYVPVDGANAEVLVDGDTVPAGPTCRLLNKAGGYLMSDGVLGDIGDETPDDGRWDERSEPFFGSGTALVMRRETFDRIGGFAAPFFAYYEDADWCWRARLGGMRILYDPASSVEHRHSATMGTSTPFAARLANRNRLLTLVRNAPSVEILPALGRARKSAQTVADLVDIAAKLPWALSSRLAGSRRWKMSPTEVWNHWADRGISWDRGPSRA